MICANQHLVVLFDEAHNKLFNIAGIELIRPDEWEHKAQQEEGGKHTTTGENTNYIETKPQVATIVFENNSLKTNGYGKLISGTRKYPYDAGDKVFLHYMAHVSGEYAKIEGRDEKEAIISADFVFFTFMPDGLWKMADEIYLGEQQYEEENITPSGIILDAYGPRQKACIVKLTNVPTSQRKYAVGDVIATIDNYQYRFTFEGKDYIMVREREIAGKFTD